MMPTLELKVHPIDALWGDQVPQELQPSLRADFKKLVPRCKYVTAFRQLKPGSVGAHCWTWKWEDIGCWALYLGSKTSKEETP